VGDEGNYLEAVRAVYTNHLNPFIEVHSYKPPALFFSLAVLFKIFTPSRELAHLFTYLFSSLTLFFTYVIGATTIGKKASFSAVLLLYVTPVCFMQSFLFQDAHFLSAMMLMTCYFYLKKNITAYLISATILVLTKEPAIFFVGILWINQIVELIRNKKSSVKAIISSCRFLIPIIAFFLWMVVNKQTFGWYLWPQNVDIISFDIDSIFYRMSDIYLRSGIWPLFSLVIAGIVINKADTIKVKANPTVILFICLFFFYSLFFMIAPSWPRYVFPVYPFLYLSAMWFLHQLFTKRKKLFVSISLVLFSILTTWIIQMTTMPISAAWGEDDVFRIITLDRNTINYIQTEFPNALIRTSGGEDIRIYSDPLFGYVTAQTAFSNAQYWNCNDPQPDKQLLELQNQQTEYTTKQPTPLLFIDTSSYAGTCAFPPLHKQFLKRIYGISSDKITYHDIYRIIQ